MKQNLFTKKVSSNFTLSLTTLLLFLNQSVFAGKEFTRFQYEKTHLPPFQILSNDNSGLTIKLGDMPFALGDNYDQATGVGNDGNIPTSFTLSFVSSIGGNEVEVTNSEIKTKDKRIIKIKPDFFNKTGSYHVAIYCASGKLDMDDSITPKEDNTGEYYEEYNCWNQDVFVYSKNDRQLLSSFDISSLAKQFAPILHFAPDEQYFPSSLNYIFNKVNVLKDLDKEKMTLSNKHSDSDYKFDQIYDFSEIFNMMKNFGSRDLLMSAGYQGSLSLSGPGALSVRYGDGAERSSDLSKPVVYYSIIPSHTSKDIFYLNYHFLYPYDSKGGDDVKTQGLTGIAAHAFDRESITVKLKLTNKNFIPQSVIYGAHLPDQTMAFLDSSESVKLKWEGGAVEVPWDEMLQFSEVKTDNIRPRAFIAHGSHGVYPKPGMYAVVIGNAKFSEQAGGGDVVVPANSNIDRVQLTSVSSKDLSAPKSNSLSEETYTLKDLDLLNYDPNNETAVLNFSGSWVTIFLGKPDAKFPPFTNREVDPDSYSKNAFKPGLNRNPKLQNW